MRLFSDGGEFGNTVFWDTLGGSNTASNPRSGNRCYLISSTATKYFTSSAEIYFRIAVYIPESDYQLDIHWRTDTSDRGAILYNYGLARFQASVAGSVVAYGNVGGWSRNAYHVIEVHVLISDAGGKITTRIDGVQDIDYTGDTKPTATTTVNNLYFDMLGIGTSTSVDDLALNNIDNSDGKNDISWCGDEHYEVLMPNDNGDTNDWTGSDADKVNNYALVDEIPASGADYVYSNTPTEQDMYKVTDFTATGKIVTRIWSEAIATDASGSSKQIKLGYKHGGTVYLSATKTLSSSYTRVVGNEELVDPSDSNAWEDADLDNIQFVVERE